MTMLHNSALRIGLWLNFMVIRSLESWCMSCTLTTDLCLVVGGYIIDAIMLAFVDRLKSVHQK